MVKKLSDADSIKVFNVMVEGSVVCSVNCGRNLVAHNGDNEFIRVPILAEDCVSYYQFGTLVCISSLGNDRVVWRSSWDGECCSFCCRVLSYGLEEPCESLVVAPRA